jgi:bacteriorhodopsin
MDEKVEDSNLINITKNSFQWVFYIMITACIVSIVSTLLAKDFSSRRVLFLEILITGVSSVMYYLFIKESLNKIEDKDYLPIIDRLRYNGWGITTPLMLLALCLFLSNSTKIPINGSTLLTIIGLDYVMLLFGYLGELDKLDRLPAMIFGFIPFLIIFYIIFNKFIQGHYNVLNYLLFGIYFVIWTGYGVSYIFEEKIKNIATNFFDFASKALVAFIISFRYLFA